MRSIAISAPTVQPAEIDAVVEVLRSGRLTQGERVEQLESAFASVSGTSHAVAVSNGTAALHCALAALGIGVGDEVITTPFTFIATANAIRMVGATVRFVDIRKDDFTIDVDRVAEALTPATKAVIAVDLYGQTYAGEELERVAVEGAFRVVEDAAQAVGAADPDGRPAGSLGDIATFSLYATKNVISGEGGMVTTDDLGLAEFVRRFRQHGMTGPYQYAGMGYNYRLTDLAAALAIGQVERVAEITRGRARNAAVLSDGLRDLEGIVLPDIRPGCRSAWHQYTIRVTSAASVTREQLARGLAERGIATGCYYPLPLHLVPHLVDPRHPAGSLPVAEQAAREVVSLPVHPQLSDEDLDRIVAAVRAVCRHD